MPPLPRVGSLALAEDPDFQRRSWRVQRVAWIAMAVVVLGGLAGLLGTGPLSETTRSSGELALEYSRFARMQAPTQLTLRFPAEAAEDGELRVWLDRRYVEKTKLERVVPQPDKVEVGPERLTYVFAVERGGKGPAAATFHLEFQAFGRFRGRIGSGERSIAFRQLVYP